MAIDKEGAKKELGSVLSALESKIRKRSLTLNSKGDDVDYTLEAAQELVSNTQLLVRGFAQPETQWEICLAAMKRKGECQSYHDKKRNAQKDHVAHANLFYEAYGVRAALVLALVQKIWDYYKNPLKYYNLLKTIKESGDQLSKGQEQSNDDQGQFTSQSAYSSLLSHPHEKGAVQCFPVSPGENPACDSSLGPPGPKRQFGPIDGHPPSKRFCAMSPIEPSSPGMQDELLSSPAPVNPSRSKNKQAVLATDIQDQAIILSGHRESTNHINEPSTALSRRRSTRIDDEIDSSIARPVWTGTGETSPLQYSHYSQAERPNDLWIWYTWDSRVALDYVTKPQTGLVYKMDVDKLPFSGLSRFIKQSSKWKEERDQGVLEPDCLLVAFHPNAEHCMLSCNVSRTSTL